jgi:DNA-binding transcriptional regulator YiaG
MTRCTECRNGLLERSIKPEHIEDLGGITVKLMNAVVVYKCVQCGAQETEIPDIQGLVCTVALKRALAPARLSGRELRFMRRALDMTQKEFSEAMEIAVETVSRWENDVQGVGGMAEKLVRHNICALLYKQVLSCEYDPSIITHMRFTSPQADAEADPMVMQRVIVKHDSKCEDAWDVKKCA